MEITGISIKPVKIPLKEPFVYFSYPIYHLPYLVVKISASHSAVGYGEVAIAAESTGDTEDSAIGAVEMLGKMLKGRDPEGVKAIIEFMDAELNFNSSCKAGIEAALLMIKSEANKVPLYRLIGTKKKDKIDLTYTFGMKSPDLITKEADSAIESGFKCMKVKVGKDIEKEAKVLKAIRGVSSSIKLSVDANQGWVSADEAIKRIKRIEKYELDWIEQPIVKGDIKGNAQIRKAVGTRIMLDESIQSTNDCEHAIEHEALDMVNIKLAKTGGVINAQKMIEMCNSNRIGYILGSMVDSALANAIAVHLAACYDFSACEMGGFYLIKKDIASGLELKSGSVIVPERPGTGITKVEY